MFFVSPIPLREKAMVRYDDIGEIIARQMELTRPLRAASAASDAIAGYRYSSGLAIMDEITGRLDADRAKVDALTAARVFAKPDPAATRILDIMKAQTDFAGIRVGTIMNALKQNEEMERLVGKIGRASRWAEELDGSRGSTIAALLGPKVGISDEVSRLLSAATEYQIHADECSSASLFARPAHGAYEAMQHDAALKMSLFAGSLDVLGPNTATNLAAFGSLFGEWNTRLDLPAKFWRDADYRHDMYREAEVDPWLIESDQSEVIEVLVDSGVVEGKRTPRGVAAVLEVGPVRVQITAGRTRSRAFEVVDAFEVMLREFITERLEATVREQGGNPAKWFAQRVSGDVIDNAKNTRRDARRDGEAHAPLIQFTNLGDLSKIILRGDNWEQAFQSVFGDQKAFEVDLQRLTASRRPTMHARTMDPTRLVEMVLVIQRITAMIANAGGRTDGWDDDI